MNFRSLTALVAVMSLVACGQNWNDPYPKREEGGKVLYTVFEERPKHLDPAKSYSSNEVEFTGQIYEPPLQYHFLKRPYTLEPLVTESMPWVRYWDAAGHELTGDVTPEKIVRTTYDIHVKRGIRYQPHPAFAVRPDGQPKYLGLTEKDFEIGRAHV
jgi:hypothetical protein